MHNSGMRMIGAALLAASVLVLSACGDAPGLRLRDRYQGQNLLEPNLTLAPVEHDAYGNAILRPRPLPQEWPTYRPPLPPA
jgi:hypothetical protein